MPAAKNKPKPYRPDHEGTHRNIFERNKKQIFATQNTCAICGRPVDFSLKYPDPWSATIDHIIPIDRGGHPSDLSNLQLAHFRCNRLKSDYVSTKKTDNKQVEIINNRLLPQSRDWKKFKI